MNFKNILFSIMLIIILTFIAACDNETSDGNNNTTNDGTINIASHPNGQAYNGASTGIAKVVENESELQATVKPYSGPTSWMSIFNDESEVNAGFLSLPDAAWAFNGESSFEESKDVRALIQGNMNVAGGYTVKADSGINSLKELKGKDVASDYPGNNIISVIFQAQLDSVSMSVDDMNPVPTADPVSGFDALKEGKVEAAFTGSPEAAGTQELNSATPIKPLNYGDYSPSEIDNIPEEETEHLQSLVPGAELVPYNEGFVDEETTLISYPTVLIGHADNLSEDDAYEAVKTIWENYEDLHSLHPWLESWDEESMFNSDMDIPYHPGAVKFFKEIDVWTEEAEKNQDKLLD